MHARMKTFVPVEYTPGVDGTVWGEGMIYSAFLGRRSVVNDASGPKSTQIDAEYRTIQFHDVNTGEKA
jgi:hypothetical protein